MREYEGDDVGVGAGFVSEERVTVSVSIYETYMYSLVIMKEVRKEEIGRTLFTRVLRLPTKIVFPSTKYVYAVWSAVNKKYLQVQPLLESKIRHGLERHTGGRLS
jgi:hypothetical protein